MDPGAGALYAVHLRRAVRRAAQHDGSGRGSQARRASLRGVRSWDLCVRSAGTFQTASRGGTGCGAHFRESAGRRGSMNFLRMSMAVGLMLLSACKSDGRTVLTIYSPHGKDLLKYYEDGFEKANPSIDVQWVDMGSQEVLERIRAEAANPQADVWFGAPAEAFDRATREDLLEPYRPTWAEQVDPDAREVADNWYGTYLTPEVIGYNSVAVSDADAPKDWDDVLDPKWKGRVLIRDPIASGTMRAIFGAIMARSMAQTGKPDAGPCL